MDTPPQKLRQPCISVWKRDLFLSTPRRKKKRNCSVRIKNKTPVTHFYFRLFERKPKKKKKSSFRSLSVNQRDIRAPSDKSTNLPRYNLRSARNGTGAPFRASLITINPAFQNSSQMHTLVYQSWTQRSQYFEEEKKLNPGRLFPRKERPTIVYSTFAGGRVTGSNGSLPPLWRRVQRGKSAGWISFSPPLCAMRTRPTNSPPPPVCKI